MVFMGHTKTLQTGHKNIIFSNIRNWPNRP